MKAYLSFNGFSRMIDIPRPLPYVIIPIMELTELYLPCKPDEMIDITSLTFYRDGELGCDNETILQYRWDGKFPRSKS